MNGKIVGLGLASIFALLIAMSAAGVVFAGCIPGPLLVSIPTAGVTNLQMYGGTYTSPDQEACEVEIPGDTIPVVVQEIGVLTAPLGQTITRTMYIAEIPITVTISMNSASMSNVLMKAVSVASQSGSLDNVTMESRGVPLGLMQTVGSGTLDNLVALVYFVGMDSLDYTGLSISIAA